MDTVLGLSITATTVSWVLVDGARGGAAPAGEVLAGEQLSVARPAGLDAGSVCEYATAIVAHLQPILTSDEQEIRGIGVCWGTDATAAAALVMEILAGSGFDGVVPVRPGRPDDPTSGHLLAREAALAAVRCPEPIHPLPETIPADPDDGERPPTRSAQLSYAGARALLVAGAVTLVTSVAVVLSPHLGPAPAVSRATPTPVSARAAAPGPGSRPPGLPETPTPLGALWEAPPAGDTAPSPVVAPQSVAPQPDGSRSLLDRVRDHLPHLPGH